MKPRPWIILAAAGCSLVAWRTALMAGDLAQAGHAAARAADAESLAFRIAALRLQQPTAGLGERPKDDLLSVVHAIAAKASIPTSTVRDVAPAAERAANLTGAAAGGVVQQSATITLEPLALADLGLFLAAWSSDQRIWSAERINLTPLRFAPPAPTRYRVQLSVEAQYLLPAPTDRTAP